MGVAELRQYAKTLERLQKALRKQMREELRRRRMAQRASLDRESCRVHIVGPRTFPTANLAQELDALKRGRFLLNEGIALL